MLIILFRDFINLDEFRDKAHDFIELREFLRSCLIKLYKMNESSHKLSIFIEGFVKYLGFEHNKHFIFQHAK